jgi:hypothetical protein
MDLTACRVRIVTLRKARWRLEGKLMGKPKPMLDGPLVERYAPCGKPNCRCKKKGAKGHGPYYYAQIKVKGKYTLKYLGKRAELIELARNYSEYMNEMIKIRKMNRIIDRLLTEINRSKMKNFKACLPAGRR